jgi:hypothetical protein
VIHYLFLPDGTVLATGGEIERHIQNVPEDERR